MISKRIDWETVEAQARGMSVDELLHAIEDCTETAALTDAIDCANNRDESISTLGGFYRDQASVYRAELRRRGEPQPPAQAANPATLTRTLLRQISSEL